LEPETSLKILWERFSTAINSVEPTSLIVVKNHSHQAFISAENEHPPAIHKSFGWCKNGYINQMVKLDSHRFKGIAGRSNIESRQGVKRPTSNTVFCQFKKNTEQHAAQANLSFEIVRFTCFNIGKAQRHQYWTFEVGRSMFDVQSVHCSSHVIHIRFQSFYVSWLLPSFLFFPTSAFRLPTSEVCLIFSVFCDLSSVI